MKRRLWVPELKHGIIMQKNNQVIEDLLIKAGIILPDDKINSIVVEIPTSQNIAMNGRKISGTVIIKTNKNSLLANGRKSDKINFLAENNNDFLLLKSVPTGRGFHWQHTIQVQLSDKIIIQNIDGYLFVINELMIEEYLPFVATAEMNAGCPIALLEAQIIAARSWLLANRKAKHPALEIDACNDDCCQRYQGQVAIPSQTWQAIRNTAGMVLMFENEVCDARYSKCCGGITESFENAWGGNPVKYLSSVSDFPSGEAPNIANNEFISSSPTAFCSEKFVNPNDIPKYLGKVDKIDSYYRWKISLSQSEMTATLNQKLNLNAKEIIDLTPIKRGYSGRIIELEINYIDKFNSKKSIKLKSEYDIRDALHSKFLYSSAINIEQIDDSNRHIKLFKFKGAGWGHGVGLCQIGALGMALAGHSAEEILQHYFTGTTLQKMY